MKSDCGVTDLTQVVRPIDGDGNDDDDDDGNFVKSPAGQRLHDILLLDPTWKKHKTRLSHHHSKPTRPVRYSRKNAK